MAHLEEENRLSAIFKIQFRWRRTPRKVRWNRSTDLSSDDNELPSGRWKMLEKNVDDISSEANIPQNFIGREEK